jgi:hypothetical protein
VINDYAVPPQQASGYTNALVEAIRADLGLTMP